jgi:hypothetical protein
MYRSGARILAVMAKGWVLQHNLMLNAQRLAAMMTDSVDHDAFASV